MTGAGAARALAEPGREDPFPAPGTPPPIPRRSSRGTAALRALPIVAFAAGYGGLSLLKHRHYLHDDIDLAIFVQALERLLEGSYFLSIRGMSWPGDHASYVLFLIAPLHALFRSPSVLLLLQSAVLALGAIPVFRLAERALCGREPGNAARPAAALAAAWLLQPALGHLALFEFHPEIVATTALLFAIEALTRGRARSCLVWAGLALLAREDVALVVAALGIGALAFRRPRAPALGGGLLIMALAALAITLLVVRPRFASPAAEYGLMYRNLGDSPAAVLATALRDPLRVLGLLFATPGDPLDSRLKLELWFQLLMPLAFLPLLAPGALLIAMPVLAEHLVSTRTQQHTILYQYSALVLPVLAWGAIEGVQRLAGRSPALARRAAFAALACAFLGQAAFGPMGVGWFQTRRPIQRAIPTARDRMETPIRDRMLASLPPRGGVVAGFEFLSRLADRDDVHSLHHVLSGAYTYSSRPYPEPERVAAVLADWSHPRLRLYAGTPEAGRRIRRLVERNGLRPVAAAGDLVLFARGAPAIELVGSRDGAAPWPARARIDGALELIDAAVAGAPEESAGTVRLTTTWRRVAPIDAVYLLRIELRDGDGRVAATRTRVLGYVVWPVADWPLGTLVTESCAFAPDPGLHSGRYEVRLRLARMGADAPVRFESVGGRDRGEAVHAGSVFLGEAPTSR